MVRIPYLDPKPSQNRALRVIDPVTQSHIYTLPCKIYHNTYSANIGGQGFGQEFGTQKSPYF